MLNLKELAHRLRIGQKDIGRVIGVKQSQVSLMMNGRRDIRAEHVAKLRAAYGDVVLEYCIAGAEELLEPEGDPSEVPAEPAPTTIKSEGPSDLKTLVSDLLAEIHTQNEVILQQHAEICEQNRRYHELVKLLTNRRNEDE